VSASLQAKLIADVPLSEGQVLDWSPEDMREAAVLFHGCFIWALDGDE